MPTSKPEVVLPELQETILCTCPPNAGCTKPCDRNVVSAVPLSEELRIEAALLSDESTHHRRLKSILNRAADTLMLSAAPQQPVEDGLARIAGMTFLLHENPDADEDIPPTQLVMAMSVGDTVYCHRITHGNNGICRDDAPQQHGQEVDGTGHVYSPVSQEEEAAIDEAAGFAKVTLRLPTAVVSEIDRRALADGCVRNAYLRSVVEVIHQQQPAEAVAEVGPAWSLRYVGQQPIAEICRRHPELRIGTKLYTTPPPAIDIGKLRELVAKWRSEADRWRKDGLPDALAAAHNAEAYIRGLTAIIGDGGEKGNG